MKIRDDRNEYATPIRVYLCDSCGREFSVCPAPRSDLNWSNCLAPDCSSYDPARDVDGLFGQDTDEPLSERTQ